MEVEKAKTQTQVLRPQISVQQPSFPPELMICYGLPSAAIVFFAMMASREDWISFGTTIAQLIGMLLLSTVIAIPFALFMGIAENYKR